MNDEKKYITQKEWFFVLFALIAIVALSLIGNDGISKGDIVAFDCPKFNDGGGYGGIYRGEYVDKKTLQNVQFLQHGENPETQWRSIGYRFSGGSFTTKCRLIPANQVMNVIDYRKTVTLDTEYTQEEWK